MDVVVTGAGGFSGSHVVRALAAAGHRITAVTGRTLGRFDTSLRGVNAITGDLAGDLPLPRKIDAIVHTAALSPAPGITDADMVHANQAGTERLAAYAHDAGAHAFIYLSSLSIYGKISVPVVDETTPIVDPDVYGVTKYKGELALRRTPGSMRSLSIRLPGVLGRHSVRNWLTTVVARAKADQDISIYGADQPFNNAAHIDDICRFVDALLQRGWNGHDAVTIGAAGETTVGRAVDIVVRTLASRSRVLAQPPRTNFLISSQHARTQYGYAPMDIEAMLTLFAQSNRD